MPNPKYPPMNKVYKRKWLKALRSGEYAQGKGRFVTILPDGSHQFCCLAVLADILPQEVADWWLPSCGNVLLVDSRRESKSGALTDAVANHVEISAGADDRLAYMNDYDNKSFKQIAAWIERNL